MSKDPAFESYLRDGLSWDMDREAMNARFARISAWVAFGASFLTVAAILALVLLMPLKRVEPFVIRVDNTTGIVDVVPVYAGNAQVSEAVTRYLLSHYVQTCERFTFATAERDYEECGAFHSAQRNQQWLELWTKTNPQSPLNLYRDGSTVQVNISAISFFKRSNGATDLAQIRYSKGKRTAGSAMEQLTHWIATVQYAYAKPAVDPKQRAWNPLGFKVIEFRAEPEVQMNSRAMSDGADLPQAVSTDGGQP